MISLIAERRFEGIQSKGGTSRKVRQGDQLGDQAIWARDA